MADDGGDIGGDVGGDVGGLDVTDSLPTYDSATDSGTSSLPSSYGSYGGPTWGSIAAGYQSAIDSYAGMGPLPSSHSMYGGFGSKAGAALDDAMGIAPTSSSVPTGRVGSRTVTAEEAKSQSSSKGSRGGGLMGGGSFKVPPAAQRWLERHVGADWLNKPRAKGHAPYPTTPGGGADFAKINEMGMAEEAGMKANAIQNARNETVKQVMSTLPTPSPREVSPTSIMAKPDTSTPADSLHKAAYWKEYYSLPPEARSYLQPGVKKAYVDIMEKALKSAGI